MFSISLTLKSQSNRFVEPAVTENRYSEIDKYAKRAPLFVGLSYKKLSNYLTEPYSNDEEKVRSITYWMTQHIKYNFRKAGRVKRKLQQPNKTLWKRNGICGDYSLLFKELCEHAGIPAEMVDGYSKGYYFEPKDTLIRADHTWNGVLINNEWKLIDVLWMGGHAVFKKQYFRKFMYLTFNIKYRKKYKYVKYIDEKYYLAEPKEMIKTHLPLYPWWQTLERIVPVEVFESDSMKWFLDKENNVSAYKFYDNIWQDRNGKNPDKFLYNGNIAHKYNSRNNRVLADAYFMYGCYLGNETYESEIENEAKIKIYDNVIDSLKKGKSYNKLYKQDIKQERKTRQRKNRAVYTRLFDRNNEHIKSDRKIINDNYSYKNKLHNLKTKLKSEKYRIKRERKKVLKVNMRNIRTKKDSSKIKSLAIEENNAQIKLLKDSIKLLFNNIYYLKKDTLNDFQQKITFLRTITNQTVDTCIGYIDQSCSMRHWFAFSWYDADPIDSIEALLLPRFVWKDEVHLLKKGRYDKYISTHKELIKKNKKVSKFYKTIIKKLKQNKNNNVRNEEIESELKAVKLEWLSFNLSIDTVGQCAVKRADHFEDELIYDRNIVKGEVKKLKKEKRTELKRHSSWSRYYIQNLISWRKIAVYHDKAINSCIQNVRKYKSIAKKEIKKAEEELKKQEKRNGH